MMIISTLLQLMNENPDFLRCIEVKHLLLIAQVSFASAIAIGLVSRFLGSLCAALVVFLALFSVGVFVVNALLERDRSLWRHEINSQRWRANTMRMHECEMRAHELDSETRVLALLNELGELLACPILCAVPEDPVVSDTGFIFSSAQLERLWHSHIDGRPVCPMTRAPLGRATIVRSLRQLCKKLNAERAGSEEKIGELQKAIKFIK
jgi:hypothetical protein